MFDALGAELIAGELVPGDAPLLNTAFDDGERIAAVGAAAEPQRVGHGSLLWSSEPMGRTCRARGRATVLAITKMRVLVDAGA
jgi:beta-glucosidase-like glycosyl hydrolase